MISYRQLESKFDGEDVTCAAQFNKVYKLLRIYASEVKKSGSAESRMELKSVMGTLAELERQFHRPPLALLKLALGSAKFVLHKKERVAYKQEYENFKLTMTFASLVLTLLILFLKYRWLETLHSFLLLYFYSTVTLREHILIINGSNIHTWWLVHHYLSLCLAGVVLTWPSGSSFDLFRFQFYIFAVYAGSYFRFMILLVIS